MIIIGQTSSKEVLEQHFELTFGGKQLYRPAWFIDQKNKAWVVNGQRNPSFEVLNYGMVPFWSRKVQMHFESPVEGSVNPGAERLKKRIIIHPSFRRPVRENRCLIPVSYIIVENVEGEPYLILSPASKVFALAGIYDNWKEQYFQKDFYQGFSILTIPSGPDFKKAGIERLPVILSERFYKRWLNPDTPLAEITRLMEVSVEKKLNGYPVSRKLYMEKCNDSTLIKPVGEMLRKQQEEKGMIAGLLHSIRQGWSERKDQEKEPQPWWRGKVS